MAIIVRDLNELVNTDLPRNLCPTAAGRSGTFRLDQAGPRAWHWYAIGDPIYREQHAWVDAAAELGFEYYLVDDGWKKWSDGDKDSWACLKEVVDYAKDKHVGILVWVACKDLWKAADRRAYLSGLRPAAPAASRSTTSRPATPTP